MNSADNILIIASPDLAKAREQWVQSIESERQLAQKTVEAYERDVEQFFRFLTEHLGHPPKVKDLSKLRPAAVSYTHLTLPTILLV